MPSAEKAGGSRRSAAMKGKATGLIMRPVQPASPTPPEWAKFLAKCRKSRSGDQWFQFVPFDLEDDYFEFGEDAVLMQAVARVAHAVKFPPKS